MIHEVSRVFLRDASTGEAVEAELWDAITEQHLADWEAEWIPALQQAIRKLNQMGVERRFWPQNRHWHWHQKMHAIQGLLSHQSFAIMCDDMTQGMMIVDVTTRARLKDQAGQHLVYIEYLESAPWNRKELLYDPARYRGIGTILVRAAIEQSKLEGFKGRIGLHSLPQSNGFYANVCAMTDLGADPDKEGLRYFEMMPEQAERFIAKGGQQ